MTHATILQRRLLEGLYIKTIEGNISWSYDQSADSCQANFGLGYVEVLSETDEDGDYFNYVRILNLKMELIENIYGGTVGHSIKPVNTSHSNYWELIRDLMSTAKRSATGADEVMQSILIELEATNLRMDDVPF